MTGDIAVLTWIGTPKNKYLKIVLTSFIFEAPIYIVSVYLKSKARKDQSLHLFQPTPGQDTIGTNPIRLLLAETVSPRRVCHDLLFDFLIYVLGLIRKLKRLFII